MAILQPMTSEEYTKKYGVEPFASAASTQPEIETQPKRNLLQNLGQVGVGVGKSFTGATKGMASLGENIGDAISTKVFGDKTLAPKFSESIPKNLYEPTNTAQKVGKFAGDVAQFVAPGGAVTKVTKGLQVGTKVASKLNLGTKAANIVSKGVDLGVRSAGEGLTAGGVSAVQRGEFNKESRDVAILSAIFPAAGKLAAGMKVKIGEKAAPRIINSLIKPLKKDMAYGKNPGMAVAKEKILANSLDDLETKIGEKLGTRLTEYEQKLAQSKTPFNLQSVLKPLDDIIDKAVRQNNQAAVNRLQEVKQALTTNLLKSTDDTGKIIITPGMPKNLSNLTATEIREFKQAVGELTRFTGNMSDDELVNKALKQVYGQADEILNKAVPESKGLSSRIADLISAKTATKYRNELMERQNLLQFTPKVIGGAGIAMSIFTGGNPVPAIIGLGIAGMEKAMSTPAFKTRFASWLASASNEQKRELIQKAPWIKGTIQKMISD